MKVAFELIIPGSSIERRVVILGDELTLTAYQIFDIVRDMLLDGFDSSWAISSLAHTLHNLSNKRPVSIVWQPALLFASDNAETVICINYTTEMVYVNAVEYTFDSIVDTRFHSDKLAQNFIGRILAKEPVTRNERVTRAAHHIRAMRNVLARKSLTKDWIRMALDVGGGFAASEDDFDLALFLHECGVME